MSQIIGWQLMPRSLHQGEISATGGDDYEVHYDKHRVVAPSICSCFTPEACVPDENLLLDRAEQDQDQTGGSELSQNAKNHSETSGEFSRAEKNCEPFAHFNILASRVGVLEVIPSTRDGHDPDHYAQEK
jgi:hypothetical protein